MKFKNLLFKAIGPIFQPNWYKASLDDGYIVYSNEGPYPFPRADDKEIRRKYIDKILKSCCPELLGPFHTNLAQSILG